MHSGLFATVLLYLMAFGISLLCKIGLDRVAMLSSSTQFAPGFAQLSQYTPWLYTLSIPIFGVFQIVAKTQLALWFEAFIHVLTLGGVWNFKKVFAVLEMIIKLFQTVLTVPIYAFIFLVDSAIVFAVFCGFAIACFLGLGAIWALIFAVLGLLYNPWANIILCSMLIPFSLYVGFNFAHTVFLDIAKKKNKPSFLI
jgi:hypothetical protein